MLAWTIVSLASAQSRGLADDPNYAVYSRAVDGLGFSATPRRGDELPQIGIGTVGVVLSGTDEVGRLVAITAPLPAPPHYLETIVLDDAGTIEWLSWSEFTIAYDGFVPNSAAGVAAELTAIRDDDQIDGAETFYAVEQSITNKTIPNDPMLNHPNVVSVTPALNPNLDLSCLELVQAGALQGWLLRERRDLGDDGVLWFDHWFYRKNYNIVDAANDSVIVRPSPLGCGSIPEFVLAIKVASIGPNPLVRYQPSPYTLGPLSAIAN